jgi:hypothetical protein
VKIILTAIVLILVLLPSCLSADERNSSFQFLNALYSPRLASLGASYSSLGEDISAMYSNPAGLAWMGRGEITCNYGDYLLDLKGGWLGGSYPLTSQMSLGGGIIYFDYGSFTKVDHFGDLTGNTFEARDLALSGSIAGIIRNSFSWGLTLKYVYSKIDLYSARAAAADVGVLYRAKFLDNLTIGMAVRNLGQSLDAYYQDKESLPTTLSFAFSKRMNPSPVTIHFGWNNLKLNNIESTNALKNLSMGYEIGALQQLTLRMGYNNQRERDLEDFGGSSFSGISAGFGVQLGTLQFDYGYANYGEPGATHTFGLTFRLADKKERLAQRTDQKTLYPDLTVPPGNVRSSIAANTLTISWEPVAGALYNVYVRLERSTKWVLINKEPQKKNYINLKSPQTKGTYIFAITLVAGERESYFSKEIRVVIP